MPSECVASVNPGKLALLIPCQHGSGGLASSQSHRALLKIPMSDETSNKVLFSFKKVTIAVMFFCSSS